MRKKTQKASYLCIRVRVCLCLSETRGYLCMFTSSSTLQPGVFFCTEGRRWRLFCVVASFLFQRAVPVDLECMYTWRGRRVCACCWVVFLLLRNSYAFFLSCSIQVYLVPTYVYVWGCSYTYTEGYKLLWLSLSPFSKAYRSTGTYTSPSVCTGPYIHPHGCTISLSVYCLPSHSELPLHLLSYSTLIYVSPCLL